MFSPLDARSVQLEQIGNVTLVTFTSREFVDEAAIHQIGQELVQLAQRVPRPQLLLNLAAVKKLSTMMLGQFIALHKQTRATGGRLVLCRLDPQLQEVLRLFRISQLIPVYAEEQEALQTF